MWTKASKTALRDWRIEVVSKPYLLFQSKLNVSYSHKLEAVVIPPHVFSHASLFCNKTKATGQVYPKPRAAFRLFALADSEDVLVILIHFNFLKTPFDKLIVEDYVIDLLKYFNSNHKEGIRQAMQIAAESSQFLTYIVEVNWLLYPFLMAQGCILSIICAS